MLSGSGKNELPVEHSRICQSHQLFRYHSGNPGGGDSDSLFPKALRDSEGDERLLDIGCGRGAVLLMAAQRLPHGLALGVDVWSATDQSGNAQQVTKLNAVLEGVAERVDLHTADMRQPPLKAARSTWW